MRARLWLLGRVLFDCTLIASLIWIVLYVFSGVAPPARLFATVWTYAVAISAPAHVILGWVFPMTRGGALLQWTVFVVLLTLIAIAGSVLGTLMVIGLGLESQLGFAMLLALSLKASLMLALLVGVVQAMIQRLNDRLYETERKLQAQALEHERALTLASEARLAALEARLNPHFLFNALNTVTSLIPAQPAQAERLIERLSAVLRSSLENEPGRLVSLAQEMKLVRSYLEIQNARFGERLRVAVDVHDDFAALPVPSFSVQTLVENSVKFAVASDRRGADVEVRARQESGHIRIEVADNGPGFSLDEVPAGHGLDNLRGRLTLTFGSDLPPLDVRRADGWTTVSFRVPQ